VITPEKVETFLKDNQLNNVFTSPNTVRAYRSKLSAWTAFSVGTGNADDLCLAEKYLEHLTESHGSKTVKSTLYVLKSFYDWVKSEQNPFEYLSEHYRINKRETALKKLDRDQKVYSQSDVARLLAHARGEIQKLGHQNTIDYYLAYRNWFMVFVLSEYGMRISGLVGIDTEHILTESRYMTIYDSKNGSPYPVPLKSNLSALRSYLAVRSGLMNDTTGENRALLLSKNGKRLSDTSARRAINVLASGAGLYDAGRSTHQLRHYRATKYYTDGMPLDLISAVMGVSVQVLKTTYLHLTEHDTVKQYETWLDRVKAGYVCPRCGFAEGNANQQKTDYDKPNLRSV